MTDALYRHLLLPVVRRITREDAETAHEWFLHCMKMVEKSSLLQRLLASGFSPDPRLSQTLLDGVRFPTPFGIAAGFDKNAAIAHSLCALSSPGFIEVGTVTARPQAGNPRPRIVRANKNNLINAMGFPNEGMAAVLARLTSMRALDVPLGLNIGKMKDTSEADAAADYAGLIAALAPLYAARKWPDYFVINVSSPNTPGLTAFQKIEPLTEIISAVCDELDMLNVGAASGSGSADAAGSVAGGGSLQLRRRLLIKLGADLSLDELESIVEMSLRFDIGGLITTNTTTTRPIRSRYNDRPGGFSGSDLFDRSAALTRHAASLLPTNKVLVATGGIDTVDRAYEMLRYADLIGGYTGLVLQGPHLFRRLSRGVAERMEVNGVSSLAELRAAQRTS